MERSEILKAPRPYSDEIPCGAKHPRRTTLTPLSLVYRQAKGTGKGRSKQGAQDTEKCEVHLLGGKGMSQMVFAEAWGEVAVSCAAIATRGSLITIAGARVVAKRPIFSTSKLSYYIRIQGPLDIQTRVQVMPAGVGPP